MRPKSAAWAGLTLLMPIPDGVFIWALLMTILLSMTLAEVYRKQTPPSSGYDSALSSWRRRGENL